MTKKSRIQKVLSLVIVFALVLSVFPPGFINKVEANTDPDGSGDITTFKGFILDDPTRSRLGAFNSSDLPNSLGRSTPQAGYYSIANNQLSISGTTVGLSTTHPIFVKVEQMVKVGTTTPQWMVVSQVSNTPLIRDSNRLERFTSSIGLRDGMNKLTFTGTNANGIGTVAEVMYVRYDSKIFVNSISLMDGANSINLDDSMPAVAQTRMVTFVIKATNSTRVIFNNREYLPLGDEFYVGPFNLEDGLNQVKFTVVNSEGTQQEYNREVYFYNPNSFFVSGSLKLGSSSPKSVYYKDPRSSFAVQLTDLVSNGSEFEGKILVPYLFGNTQSAQDQADEIENNITATISSLAINPNLGGTVSVDPTKVKFLRGPMGIDYALYPVTIRNWTLTERYNDLRNPVTIKLDTNNVAPTPSSDVFTFNVVDQNLTIIDEVSYSQLPLSAVTATNVSPVNGRVAFGFKYTGQPIAGKQVIVTTPFDSVGKSYPVGANDTVEVEDLPSGEYNITFRIDGQTVGMRTVRIRIDNTPSIVFVNFSNGITIDAKDLSSYNQSVIIELYKADNDINGTTFSVNGTPQFEVRNGSLSSGNMVRQTDKTIITTSPVLLRRGENTFVFELKKNNVLVTKRTITFFIDDSRIPDLREFKPVLAPQRGERPLLTDNSAVSDTNGISYNKLTGNHTTTSKEFDIILQAIDVKQLKLTLDGEELFNAEIDYNNATTFNPASSSVALFNQFNKTATPSTSGFHETEIRTLNSPDNKLRLRFVRDELSSPRRDRFTLRIEGLTFFDKDQKNLESLRSFNLTMVNKNGSIINVPMTVTRQTEPYLIHSPIATVGSQIIVNKDYVPIYIEAEGATEVIIGKEKAEKSREADRDWWFTYMYTGLKPDKWNPIKFTVVRGTEKINGQIDVYYGTTNQEGAASMVPLSTKMTALNNTVSLSFPKNILLRQREAQDDRQKLFQGHHFLFGNADLQNGLIDRTDYKGETIRIATFSNLRNRFAQIPDTFVPVSQVIFINGGLGDKGSPTSNNYLPSIKYGLQPHEEAPYGILANQKEYAFTNLRYSDRVLAPSERGQLSLKFDTSVRAAASPTVTVFRMTQDGRWENIGGVVKKDQIVVPFDEFGYYVVMRWRDSFEDLMNHPWGANVMQIAYAKGLMPGRQKSVEFGANDPITRGEFVQMIVKAMDLPINDRGTETFLDVRRGSTGPRGSMDHEGWYWEYKYIETAARAGIVSGVSSGLYLPNNRITREQASAILANALNLKLDKNDSKLESNLYKAFRDGTSVAYYFRPAVMAVNRAKIMGGVPNPLSPNEKKVTYNFNPKANLSRAEAAAMIVRVMQNQLKSLPKDVDTTNPQAQF